MTVGAEPSKTSPPKWQSTIFGGALLRRETIKSFQWLFTSFKWCMAGCRKLRCIPFTLFVPSNHSSVQYL